MTDYTLSLKKIFRCAVLGLMLACTWCACKKKELMPPPVGEPVTYADSSLTFPEFMKKSSSYSLFWKAWQRSTIEKILKEYDPNYEFSLFIPDNAAMTAEGFDNEKILSLPINELDSLMRIHTVPKKIYPKALDLQTGNLELPTLFLNKSYFEPGQYDSNPGAGYRYRHYLALKDGNIFVNGKSLGPVSQVRVLKGATVFPITKVLKKPAKGIRQVLFEDGRFKMYLAIRRYNDSLYNALIGLETGYTYNTPYENRYVGDKYGFGRIDPVLDFLSPLNYVYDTFAGQFETSNVVYQTTILVPTDEAFRKAGFNKLEDLIVLNQRALPFPQYPGSTNLSGYLPTDSILNQHYWGNNNVPVEFKYHNYDGAIQRTARPLMILYSNDLRNEIMSDFKVHILEWNGRDYSDLNSLDFIHDGEMIRVRVKGSNAEPATLIQKDIETFNGVVHVLDRLLLPPGFKLP